MTILIQTEDASFHYRKSKDPVFKHIDLSFEQGSFTTILGANGSGKSTLLKHFNGLILPKEGRVKVLDKDTADAEHWLYIRQNVGLIFQNPENQLISTIVEEDVAFALENLGVEREEIRRRVDEALKMVHMYEYRLHPPHQLSGGQKQRVAIAGILAMRPRCILFDEATSMLDPAGRKDIMAIIRQLHHEFGLTVIMITHLMEEVVDSDRVIVMDKGSIRYDGSPKDVFAHTDELETLGLTVPLTAKLSSLLKKEGFHLSDETLLTPKQFISAVQNYLEVER